MERLIIGLAGDPGSGKTELADYLATRHNFYHFEGSSGIRDAAKREGVALRSRHDYSSFHADLQRRLGKDILAQTLLTRPEDRLVFAGLRSTHNARSLQSARGVIISLVCPLEVCFSRIDHSGLKYETNLGDFQRTAEAERHSLDGYGADVQPVLDMADLTLDTSQPIETCFRLIDDLVSRMLRE